RCPGSSAAPFRSPPSRTPSAPRSPRSSAAISRGQPEAQSTPPSLTPQPPSGGLVEPTAMKVVVASAGMGTPNASGAPAATVAAMGAPVGQPARQLAADR